MSSLRSDLQAPSRLFALEGVFNVRDIGGYRAGDRTVRWRRVIRAGGPHGVTESDAASLRALGITTVMDLRTGDEARERGSYVELLMPRSAHHLPMTDVLPGEAELERWPDPQFVADHYFEMLVGASDAIAAALAVLGDPDSHPVLVHCSAGKDRTGVLIAVLLAALGVDDQTIIEDYALSEPAMRSMLAFFERGAPDAREQLARHAPAILAARPQTMAAFLSQVRDTYGDFDGYVSTLGAADDVANIRAALLD